MKLSSVIMIGLLIIGAPSARAMQLPCGEHEVVGEYSDADSTLTLSPGSNGALPLILTGPKVLDGFLPVSGNFYRVTVDIRRSIRDEGGAARLLNIHGMELPTGSAHPVISSKPHACK